MSQKETTKPQMLVKQEDASVHQLISQAIDRNVAVDTMEKLLAMRRELKSEWAREEFQKALAAFQADCPIIKKTKKVMNKDGKTERYRYAPIDSILKQVKHLLEKHGFNYRVDAKIEGRVVLATCIITHSAGHSETSNFAVPTDPDAYMSEQQKFASALTFAKRYAFVDAFGILTGDEDNDASVIIDMKPEKHSRTKAYEEKTGEGDTKVQDDLAQLLKFLEENKIPEAFILRILQEKKLIDGHTKFVSQLKPGILIRCLNPKTKENFVASWKASQVDESEPTKEDPKTKAPETKAPETNHEVVHENSQAATVRKPCQRDLSPRDVLEQDGYDNWRKVPIHFGKKMKGVKLGTLTSKSLIWWIETWHPELYNGRFSAKDVVLDAALCLASEELAGPQSHPFA